MDPADTFRFRLAVGGLVRVLEGVVRNPRAQEELAEKGAAGTDTAGTPTHAERVERAVERYVERADVYVAALTRKSEREAAIYLETGLNAAEIMALGELKSDHTDDALRSYRRRLAQLAHRGLYAGPVRLQRLRDDGTWEPLRLPGD